MKVLLESRQTFFNMNNQKIGSQQKPILINRREVNTIPFTSNNFLAFFKKGNMKLAEKRDNLIIEDIFKFEKFIPAEVINAKNPVDKINSGLSFTKERLVDSKGACLEKITIKDDANILLEATKDSQHKNVNIGFFIGKAGTYGLLEVKSNTKGLDSYIVVVPKGSEIDSGDGLTIKLFDSAVNPEKKPI